MKLCLSPSSLPFGKRSQANFFGKSCVRLTFQDYNKKQTSKNAVCCSLRTELQEFIKEMKIVLVHFNSEFSISF